MAFDPNDSAFQVPEPKKLPVLLLLDVSSSMSGDKINSLYDSVTDMLQSFSEAKVRETLIEVAIITFGDRVTLHTPLTLVDDLRKAGVNRFIANGMTPMGTALKMAKAMIEDKSLAKNRYRHAVVLVSDGAPTDEWRTPLHDFITPKDQHRSHKCQRFSVAIGTDANKQMLREFCGGDDTLFFAEQAADLVNAFKKISTSISNRAGSGNPNKVDSPAGATYDTNTAQDEDDDSLYI